VFWIARTGAAWRDLHSHFGTWNSVYRQFRRWTLARLIHEGAWRVVADVA
jgi:transposase